MKYLVKTPWLIRKILPQYVWKVTETGKVLFLTFDDGPHPEATTFVLEELEKFNARATFFCLGKNVAEHPDLYRSILDKGHKTGNHTYNHLNGWKTKDSLYLNDIANAASLIKSELFRPPYGRMTPFQARNLNKVMNHDSPKVIMWDVLSADFDPGVSQEKCLKNVVFNSSNGSIIVFHDSKKAFSKLQYALPKVLQHFSDKGFVFKTL